MIKVFNRDNLVEASKKEPIICYRSENGACGPSGLFFVIFSDKSCYAYSTFYEKSDISLVKEIIEHVPELRMLIYSDDRLNYKRERFQKEFEEVYLGLGNYAIMTEELREELNNYDEEFTFGCFKKLVSNHLDGNIQQVWSMVREAING